MVLAGLVPVGALTASPAVAVTTGVVQVVPGTTSLFSVACYTATNCVAVGANRSNQGVIVSITNGTAGVAQVVPGTSALNTVACASASLCEAVGASTSFQGVVVPIVNGAYGADSSVPGTTELDGVACPTATFCQAVGISSANTGVAVQINSGVPGTPKADSGTNQLIHVACPTATLCQAVAVSSPANQGVVVPITDGTPGTAAILSGPDFPINIACPAATSMCEAVGLDVSVFHGVVVPVTNGTPGTAQVAPGSAQLVGIACLSASACQAVGGTSLGRSGQGVVVGVTNGTPGQGQAIAGTGPLDGVSCPSATTCVAVGLNPTFDQGVVVTYDTRSTITVTAAGSQTFGSSSPTFTPTTSPPSGDTFGGTLVCTTVGSPPVTISSSLAGGTSVLNGSSCSGLTLSGPTAADFLVSYGDGTFTVDPAATTTALAASPANPALNGPVTFTATVTSSTNAAVPGGTVGFFLDGQASAAATVTLAAGHAAFTTGLAAGPHSMVAVYSGDPNFATSTSTPASVTVGNVTVISGDHVGAVIVSSGQTVLVSGATVTGAVVVLTGGAVDVENSTIAGGLSAAKPAAIRVCGSTLVGAVTVTGATGFVLLGDPGDDGCATNTIGGAMIVTGNQHGLEVIGNKVPGTVTNNGNAGAGPFPEDTAPDVSGNHP